MSDKKLPPQGRAIPQASPALTDRVRRRVEKATIALERRDEAVPSAPQKGDAPAEAKRSKRAPLTREVRALRAVMRQLGDVHTQYRKRTGKQVSPTLRAAVQAFKQEPTLSSLLPVAVVVDDLELLTW